MFNHNRRRSNVDLRIADRYFNIAALDHKYPEDASLLVSHLPPHSFTITTSLSRIQNLGKDGVENYSEELGKEAQ